MRTIKNVLVLIVVLFAPTIAAGLLGVSPAWGLAGTGAALVIRGMWMGRKR